MLVPPDRLFDLFQLRRTQADILGQFNMGFKPEGSAMRL
jgi:hypothetical protein